MVPSRPAATVSVLRCFPALQYARRKEFDHIVIETTGEVLPPHCSLNATKWCKPNMKLLLHGNLLSPARGTPLGARCPAERCNPSCWALAYLPMQREAAGPCLRPAPLPPLPSPLAPGMANPAPIITSFYADPDLPSRVRLDGVVTVVDAKNIG